MLRHEPKVSPYDLPLPRGESYKCQEKRPWLKVGAVVWVQPGTIATKRYLCIIVESQMKWVIPGTFSSMTFMELCTYVPFKHGAVIWEYWADRLSPANEFWSAWMRRFYEFEQKVKGNEKKH